MNNIDDLEFNPEDEQEYKNELKEFTRVRNSNSELDRYDLQQFKFILYEMIYYKHCCILLLLKIEKYINNINKINSISLEFKQDIDQLTKSSKPSCKLMCNLDCILLTTKTGHCKHNPTRFKNQS